MLPPRACGGRSLTICDLPNEIFLEISAVMSTACLASLAQTSSRFYFLLIADLENRAIKEDGWPISVVHWVAEKGLHQLMARLISRGADIESMELFGLLIQIPSTVFRARGHQICTPLHVAALAGHLDTVKVLIKAGASVSKPVKSTIAAVNIWEVPTQDYSLVTMLACTEVRDHYSRNTSCPQHLAILRLLLEADPDGDRPNRETDEIGPLHMAVACSQVEFIPLISAHFRNATGLNDRGYGVIGWALHENPDRDAAFFGSIAALLKTGIDADAWAYAWPELETPLQYAIRRRESPEIIELLLEAGAMPDGLAYSSTKTPLMLAIAGGVAEHVKSLLQWGADPNLGHFCGARPLLHVIRSWPSKDSPRQVFGLLLQHGAEIELDSGPDKSATSLLHGALAREVHWQEEMVTFLNDLGIRGIGDQDWKSENKGKYYNDKDLEDLEDELWDDGDEDQLEDEDGELVLAILETQEVEG